MKSDGKQIAELQAQLEKSRDAVAHNKLELDQAMKKVAEFKDYWLRTRDTYFCLRDYTEELYGLMESNQSIEEAGQWLLQYSSWCPSFGFGTP
jgi:hypothetical protein